jgi:hypothetical protein
MLKKADSTAMLIRENTAILLGEVESHQPAYACKSCPSLVTRYGAMAHDVRLQDLTPSFALVAIGPVAQGRRAKNSNPSRALNPRIRILFPFRRNIVVYI